MRDNHNRLVDAFEHNRTQTTGTTCVSRRRHRFLSSSTKVDYAGKMRDRRGRERHGEGNKEVGKSRGNESPSEEILRTRLSGGGVLFFPWNHQPGSSTSYEEVTLGPSPSRAETRVRGVFGIPGGGTVVG